MCKPFIVCPQHSFSCTGPDSLLCMLEMPTVLYHLLCPQKGRHFFLLPLQFHSCSLPFCNRLVFTLLKTHWTNADLSGHLSLFQKVYRIKKCETFFTILNFWTVISKPWSIDYCHSSHANPRMEKTCFGFFLSFLGHQESRFFLKKNY